MTPENKLTVVEKTEERVSKVESVELFQLGRMNFKKEYKSLSGIFPDIGKISRLGHFKIVWKRQVSNGEGGSKMIDNVETGDMSLMKSEIKVEGLSQLSQKK